VATLGPSPVSVIRSLQDLGCPCVMGNHDAFLLEPGLVDAYTEAPEIVEAVRWCRARLSGEELNLLRAYVPEIELSLDADLELLCVHGSPGSHSDDLLATTPAEELDRLLGGHHAAVIACGHTHIQMLRQHRGALIVNPGSVGFPFKEHVSGRAPELLLHAEYAIVEASRGGVSVDLRRAPLDTEALRRAAQASDSPLRGYLLQQYARMR
jgi:predicted phosphodiesterase